MRGEDKAVRGAINRGAYRLGHDPDLVQAAYGCIRARLAARERELGRELLGTEAEQLVDALTVHDLVAWLVRLCEIKDRTSEVRA